MSDLTHLCVVSAACWAYRLGVRLPYVAGVAGCMH